MKKFILLGASLGLSLSLIHPVHAGIFGRRGYRQTQPTVYYQAAPNYAPSYMSSSDGGYRSYSYQPNPNVPATVQPGSPIYGYPTQEPRNETGQTFHDAGFKVRGF